MEQFVYVLKPNRPAMLIDGPNPVEQWILGRHLACLTSVQLSSCKITGMRRG